LIAATVTVSERNLGCGGHQHKRCNFDNAVEVMRLLLNPDFSDRVRELIDG
jgi:hypothetical protein